MTVSELKKELIALGFDNAAGTTEMLMTAINRSLRDLYTRRSILRSVKLYSNGLKPTYYQKEIKYVGGSGETLTFPLVGRGYSMRLCGFGNYTTTFGSSTKTVQFDTGLESKLVQGFINGSGTISFYGHVSFTVYDFSVYDEIYSVTATDMPDGSAKRSIDIRKMYGDFMSFISPATDSDGRAIKNCRLSDGKLEIPADYRGEINLTYRRLPETVLNNDTSNIDVPEEYSHLFPLLTAFYLCLDTDNEKATYYREQYERSAELVGRESYQQLDFSYIDTNGWA